MRHLKRTHRIARGTAVFALLFFAVISPTGASAHPADEINERDIVHLSPDSISIDMTISAGAIKLGSLWRDADTNHDSRLDDHERKAFGEMLARGITLRENGELLALTYLPDSLAMLPTLRDFALQGADPSGAIVTASFRAAITLTDAPHEITLAVTHYRALNNNRPPDLIPDVAPTIGAAIQGGTDVDLRLTTAPIGTGIPVSRATEPRPANQPRIQGLLNAVRQPPTTPQFVLIGFLIAILLGALHALTPGHGKTLVAAYLVGNHGRVRDACALGGIVTLAHTGSVIAIGIIAITLTDVIAPERLLNLMEFCASVGILIVGIVACCVQYRVAIPAIKRARRANAVHVRTSVIISRVHEHEDGTIHSHGWFGGAAHSHAPPADLTARALIAVGVSGGIAPCPDALAVLLVAIAAGRLLFGLFVLVGFSLGLAAVLTVVGIAVARVNLSTRKLHRFGLARVGPWLPLVSAGIIVVIGCGGVARAVVAFM